MMGRACATTRQNAAAAGWASGEGAAPDLCTALQSVVRRRACSLNWMIWDQPPTRAETTTKCTDSAGPLARLGSEPCSVTVLVSGEHAGTANLLGQPRVLGVCRGHAERADLPSRS
jgi:hypothetical protein